MCFSPDEDQATQGFKAGSPAVGDSSSNLSRLPVKRVVLSKNGVGYFERVHGTQDLNIDFTTAQSNDVLKSLAAVDLGEGHVSFLRYNSIAPLHQPSR